MSLRDTFKFYHPYREHMPGHFWVIKGHFESETPSKAVVFNKFRLISRSKWGQLGHT